MRLAVVQLFVASLCLLPACRPPSGAQGPRGAAQDLPGVDTSSLTGREKQEYWGHVSALLAPCPDQPVSIAQCVREARQCAACGPAAEFLAAQVRLGRTRTQVETAFRLRFDPDTVKRVEPGSSPAKGAAHPTVTIVEWADFECPFCGRAAPELDFVLAAYPEHVRLVYKHFPLAQHRSAEQAARAAVAAQYQGKFWELHDQMYANATALDIAGIRRLARKVGLDVARLEQDMKRPEVDAVIERDRREGDQAGLTGTPLIVINGRPFELEYFDLMHELEPWVKLEIEIASGEPVTPRQVDRSKWPIESEPTAPAAEPPASPEPASSAAETAVSAPSASAPPPALDPSGAPAGGR